MKRLTGTIALAVMTVVLSAGTALAQTYPPPTSPPSVLPTSGANTPTAFTGGGSNLSFAAIAAVVLVGAGLLALALVRRRSSDASGG